MANHNTQQEISLHNLKGPQSLVHQAYILVGFLGAFSGMVLTLFPRKTRFIAPYLVPDKRLFFYFFPCFIVYSYLEYLNGIIADWTGMESFRVGGFFFWRDQEVAEFFLSLGFLLFLSWTAYWQKHHAPTQNQGI